jgi:hypothetical protein
VRTLPFLASCFPERCLRYSGIVSPEPPIAGGAILKHAGQIVVSTNREIRFRYSGTVSPEPPMAVGKSLSFGSPSMIGRIFSS